MKFTQIYNRYSKLYNIINEGSVKSLTPIIQQQLIGNKSYNDLTDQQKNQLQIDIDKRISEIRNKVNSITTNGQYQSWIYDVLKNKEQDIDEDFNDIKNTINNFIQIIKSPKLSSFERNIQNYKSFGDLHKFVYDFKNSNKQYNDVNFPLLYSNNKFNLYKIGKLQKDKFQQLYGPTGFKTAWCVADSKRQFFEKYLTGVNDYYILWLTKDNKPFALLHLNSNQFKDIHDNKITDYSDEVLDGLDKTIDNIDKLSEDLIEYKIKLLKYKNPTMTNERIFMYNTRLKCILNENGTIDVIQGDVYNHDLRSFIEDGKLTIKFNKVAGYFDCSYSELISLEGCPQSVGGDFNCSDNQLDSLKGCPQSVGGDFNCSNNKLISLEHCPQIVGGDFVCVHNKLTSLKGCPQIVGRNLNCSFNKLTSLKGCPTEVVGYFSCSYNQLDSLDHCPQIVGRNLNCSFNKLTSLKGCPQSVGGNFMCMFNQLTSLKGCPQSVGGDFNCSNNKLTSLDYAPIKCRELFCRDNPNLKLTDEQIKDFNYEIVQ